MNSLKLIKTHKNKSTFINGDENLKIKTNKKHSMNADTSTSVTFDLSSRSRKLIS